MKYFAELDNSNNVIRVCVFNDSVQNEEEATQITPLSMGHRWLETFIDGSQRKNFAGKGWIYDPNKDAFIEEKTFNSWVLNENTCRWEPPVPYPNDGKLYSWNEELINWVEINYSNTVE